MKRRTKCTHPDHIKGKDCRDRGVSCSPTCPCCNLLVYPVNYKPKVRVLTNKKKCGIICKY